MSCCDDATYDPDIPPGSDISLSDAKCAYHGKYCESKLRTMACWAATYVPGGPKCGHCEISKEGCLKHTEEKRDLCNKVHECTHNAEIYLCTGEGTCSEFSILGYNDNLSCIQARLEQLSFPFRDCCRGADGDANKVHWCVYEEGPAPEEDDYPRGRVVRAFPTAGCFSKKNKV